VANTTASFHERHHVADNSTGNEAAERANWQLGEKLAVCNFLRGRDGGDARKVQSKCTRNNSAGEEETHFTSEMPISELLHGGSSTMAEAFGRTRGQMQQAVVDGFTACFCSRPKRGKPHSSYMFGRDGAHTCADPSKAIITYKECQDAASALAGHPVNVSNETWDGTRGCHVDGLSWQFNNNMEGTGAHGHTPICRVGDGHSSYAHDEGGHGSSGEAQN
jgi:hypothetical protein